MASRALEEYENHIASISYVYNFNFDHDVENKSFLPPFIEAFLPNMYLDEFIEQYFYINQRNVALRHYLDEGKRDAIEGKITRAYSSLVREHHLFLMLEDKYKTAIRNHIIDYFWGIDVLVIRGKYVYACHAYTLTKRSKNFHEHKVGVRHKDYNVGIRVDMPLNLSTCPKIGDIFVYGPKEIKVLEDTINAQEEANASTAGCTSNTSHRPSERDAAVDNQSAAADIGPEWE